MSYYHLKFGGSRTSGKSLVGAHLFHQFKCDYFFLFFPRNIPRSILIAVPIITALYVFMNFSYLIVLTPYEMVHSTAVAVDFGTRIFGSFAFLIPLGVALVCILFNVTLWSREGI